MPKNLDEAGRMLSRKNEHLLRAAMASVEEILGSLPDQGGDEGKPVEKTKAKPKPGAAVAKVIKATESLQDVTEAVLRQSDSVDGRRELIRQALKANHADPMNPDGYVYCWIRDLFVDSVVYEYDGKLYQVSYTMDRTDGATKAIVGTPFEVELTYTPVAGAVTESSSDLGEDFVPLLEKAVRADGTVPIKIISPGWGSSGYYPADVLERDGPKIFTEGLKMYCNHPTPQEEAQRPERDLKDWVATLETAAKWQTAGPEGPGLYADAKVLETWRTPVNDWADAGGVSIRAQGRVVMGEAEGRKGPIVQQLVAAKSVDFVTDPGRGGKILSLREAAAKRHQTTPPTQEEADMPLSEAEGKALQESVSALTESVDALKTENARLREAQILSGARSYVANKLPASLPDLTKARLVESLSKNPPVKDGAIDTEAFDKAIVEAARAEVDYLAKVTGSGTVRNLGESFGEGGDPEPKPEQVQESLTESFKALGLGDEGAKIAAAGRAE